MKRPAAKAAADKEWHKLKKNLPAWSDSEVLAKADVIPEAQKTVHFETLMDFSHLKHSELAEHLQTYKGRVAL